MKENPLGCCLPDYTLAASKPERADHREDMLGVWEFLSAQPGYFSFTKSKTKIAQTPTVMGNCAISAFCMALPRGKVSVKADIANAVRIPRASFAFQFIKGLLAIRGSRWIAGKTAQKYNPWDGKCY